MSFSKGAFYGNGKKKDDKREKRWQDHLKNIAEREANFKANPCPKIYHPKIDDPCIYRKTFYRQQDAFEYARRKSEDLHVFAYESSSFVGEHTGKRMYMVCSYAHFWHYYRQMITRKACHHYEIIPEGAVCKLYFDLEFQMSLNPIAQGDEMIKTFIEFVDYHLKSHYRITPDKRQVVDLESTKYGKFSRHLIYLIKGAAFKDNIHAGKFVHHICSQLMDILRPKPKTPPPAPKESTSDVDPSGKRLRRSSRTRSKSRDSSLENVDQGNTKSPANTPTKPAEVARTEYFGIAKSRLEDLVVRDKDRKEMLFVDLGVYTKNRNFRLFKSSKLGKINPLEYKQSGYYTVSTPVGRGPVEQIYLDSMITNVKFVPYLHTLTFDENHTRVPLGRRNSNGSCSQRNPSATPLEGFTSSPYPEIDNYISSILNIGGIQGTIRRWSYFTQGELLVYDINNYRWCENIRRHHKSNNIMFLVDIKHGVYYQKCHDPECRRINFKSDEYPLPRELLPSFYLNNSTDFEDDFLEEVSDKDLILNAEEGTDVKHGGKSCVFNQTKATKKGAGGVASAANGTPDILDVGDNELLAVVHEVEISGSD